MQFKTEHVELLAETIYLAFISDGPPTYRHDWTHVTPKTKGDFRRAAQAAMRTIHDNGDWLLTDCQREGHEFALEPDAEEGDAMTCIHCGAEHDAR